MGNNPSSFKGEKNLPVESVAWDTCQKFIEKLREKDKKLYRLPSEAEWEYACRAGTTTPFHFGETISTDQANYNGDFTYGSGKKGPWRKKTTPVGSFQANAFGLYDMHGNVSQWCQDSLDDADEYGQKEAIDPQGPPSGRRRAVRGGSWNGTPSECSSAARAHQAYFPESGYGALGFRVCASFQSEEFLPVF